MNSIAIWWDKDVNIRSIPKTHLDINIWLPKQEKLNAIEFGLKIENFKSLQAIYLFLPFDCQYSDFDDKTIELSKNAKLTNALFNKNMSISNSDGIFHKVTDPEKNFFHYCNISNDDIEFKDVKDKETKLGTKICIKINNNNDNNVNTIYYRFRINKIENILKTVSENNFIIDGFFKKLNFIEFNINTVRKLPSTIVQNIANGDKFSSMNLFLITDMTTNFSFMSSDLKASRILENPIWNEYNGNNELFNKMVAYHWKKNNEFEDFSLFLKTKYIKEINRYLF